MSNEEQSPLQKYVHDNSFTIWCIIFAVTVTGDIHTIVVDHTYGLISCIVDSIIIVCFLQAFADYIKGKK